MKFVRHRRHHKMSKLKSKKGGFFLAELIVAVSIFGIVTTIAVGSLVLALDANRKTQSLKSVLNNLNIVMDSMTKTIATGTHYFCSIPADGDFDISSPLTNDCSDSVAGGIDAITLLSNYDLDEDGEPNDFVTYRHVVNGDKGYIARKIRSGETGNFGPEIRMTAPGVDIDSLVFAVTGSTPASGSSLGSDFIQPKVLITITGNAPAGPRSDPTSFNVQTVVSQRVPDFQQGTGL